LTPATGSGEANLHFLVDTIDADMFLRADHCQVENYKLCAPFGLLVWYYLARPDRVLF
jgi:hypothetical protein